MGVKFEDVYKRQVLEDAGVYKCTEEGRKAFDRFIASLQNITIQGRIVNAILRAGSELL